MALSMTMKLVLLVTAGVIFLVNMNCGVMGDSGGNQSITTTQRGETSVKATVDDELDGLLIPNNTATAFLEVNSSTEPNNITVPKSEEEPEPKNTTTAKPTTTPEPRPKFIPFETLELLKLYHPIDFPVPDDVLTCEKKLFEDHLEMAESEEDWRIWKHVFATLMGTTNDIFSSSSTSSTFLDNAQIEFMNQRLDKVFKAAADFLNCAFAIDITDCSKSKSSENPYNYITCKHFTHFLMLIEEKTLPDNMIDLFGFFTQCLPVVDFLAVCPDNLTDHESELSEERFCRVTLKKINECAKEAAMQANETICVEKFKNAFRSHLDLLVNSWIVEGCPDLDIPNTSFVHRIKNIQKAPSNKSESAYDEPENITKTVEENSEPENITKTVEENSEPNVFNEKDKQNEVTGVVTLSGHGNMSETVKESSSSWTCFSKLTFGIHCLVLSFILW